MSAPARGAAFAVLLTVVFAAAYLAGAAMDPGVGSTTEHEEETEMQTHDTGTPGGGHADHGGGAASTPPGLASAEAGYAPRQRDDGSWVAEADLGHGGVYRAFADFSTDGTSLTQGSDVFVSGEFDPVPLPEPEAVADAGDGYEVEMSGVPPSAREAAQVDFTVTKGGDPVSDVEPYLGAAGHLVALREHDLAFLHTHPEGEAGGDGPIAFTVSDPSPGRYRLYLQFEVENRVRTAAFTQVVGRSP